MLLKRTNIEEKLQRLKNHQNTEENILNTVMQILEDDDSKDEKILSTLGFF